MIKCKTCAVHRKIRKHELTTTIIGVAILVTTITGFTIGHGIKGFFTGILLCVPISFLIGFCTIDSAITCISFYNWYCKDCTHNEKEERDNYYVSEWDKPRDNYYDKNKYTF